MYDLHGKAVFVTGASAGIGKSCALAAARAGAAVAICARREDKLKDLASEIARMDVACYPFALDVRDSNMVDEQLEKLRSDFGEVDILVNNAGLGSGFGPLHTQTNADFDVMFDTNVKGLLYVTRQVVSTMVERNSGHVINVGSVAGHDVYPGGTVYCATKFAVTAITTGLKMDLHGTKVRVSTVDPGMVETDFSIVRFHGDEDRAAAVYAKTIPLEPEDVADAVMYCATRPAHVNIGTVVLTSVKQSSVTMIDRSGDTL